MFSAGIHIDSVAVPRGTRTEGAPGGLRTKKVLEPETVQRPLPGISDDCYLLSNSYICANFRKLGRGGKFYMCE